MQYPRDFCLDPYTWNPEFNLFETPSGFPYIQIKVFIHTRPLKQASFFENLNWRTTYLIKKFLAEVEIFSDS